VNRDQIPTTVDLSMDVFLAKPTVDGYWNVCGNVPIAGMKIYIGGEGARQFQRDTSVAGMQSPA
jgi:hypothetical protein